MKIISLDFETYFDTEYSLKRMTTEEYVRDPRFQPLVCAHLGEGLPSWTQLGLNGKFSIFSLIDWSRTGVIAHKAIFDGFILSHCFGIKPAFWFDTLAMARALFPRLKSHSLESLARHFGFSPKTVPYSEFKGRRALPPAVLERVGEGAAHDAWLTREIFRLMLPMMPPEELRVIDMTTRLFTEPVLRGNVARLEAVAEAERARKEEVLRLAGVTEAQMQSADKFRAALEGLGYECPMKWSEAKEEYIPALAKTDSGMMELLDHPDERVAALALARQGVKSTISETRAARFAGMARRGCMPVALRYAAAKTLRFGGEEAANWQNLPTVRSGNGEIRQSIEAPPDHMLVIADSGQVECRGVNWMAGEQWVLDAFAENRDIYSEMASMALGRTVTKETDPIGRFQGKTIELGCGYGLGAVEYRRRMGQGMLGGKPMVLSEVEAQQSVDAYRRTHPNVVKLWRYYGDRVLQALALGAELDLGYIQVSDHKAYLPNGAPLNYEGLFYGFAGTPELDQGGAQWWIKGKRGWEKYYGAKLVENFTQALFSGLLIRQFMLSIEALFARLRSDPRYHFRVALQVHDEIVSVVPAIVAKMLARKIQEIMETTPAWCAGVPLKAEVSISEVYNK